MLSHRRASVAIATAAATAATISADSTSAATEGTKRMQRKGLRLAWLCLSGHHVLFVGRWQPMLRHE